MGDETKNPVPKKEETQDLNSKWIELGFEAVKNSVDNIKSTADKIITLDTGLITIYTGALAFLNKQEYLNFYMSHIISGIIIVIPILLWIVSIYYSIEAYSTKKRFLKLDDPINIENNHKLNVLDRFEHLNVGKTCFVLGLLFASFTISFVSVLQSVPVQQMSKNAVMFNYLIYLFAITTSISVLIAISWLVLMELKISARKKGTNKDIQSNLKTYWKYSTVLSLILAFSILIISLNSYEPVKVQFIVDQDYVLNFDNMSVTVDNQTMITMPMTLISEDDTYYKVKKDNQTIIRFKKDMVKGMVYYTKTT